MRTIKINKTNKSWSKNWSGRGAAMISAFESKSSEVRKDSKHVPVLEQLRRLIQKEPNNQFYRSLMEATKAGSLSQKQITCIMKDYSKKLVHAYKNGQL